MNEFPFGYEKIGPASWAYLSGILALTLFFKFNRFLSLRNLDLLLLLLLSPGLVLVIVNEAAWREYRVQAAEVAATTAGTDSPSFAAAEPREALPDDAMPLAEKKLMRRARAGYIWLFSVGSLLLARMLLDPVLIRRPLLEPNLSVGGLTFLVCCQLVFLVAQILQRDPEPEELAGPRDALEMVQGNAADVARDFRQYGPGLGIIHLIPVLPTYFAGERAASPMTSTEMEVEAKVIAIIVAILLQLVIVFGLIYIGKRHFGDSHVGLGMAALHLMLPYTDQFGGHVLHILPAALLIWAIAVYRRPVLAGILIGLVAGVTYYPLFLLPLWFSFYWERGAARFLWGLLSSIAALILALYLIVPTWADFGLQIRSMFGFWLPKVDGLFGIWRLGWDPWFRLPFLVAFLGLSISFSFWPTRKNLGTLIAYSAALMVAVQFWHGHIYGGGLLMAWYLPVAMMAMFRPNLEEVTATS
jgi:hypothetical protein